jgi:pyruvate formate lyase activating enzyme
MKVCIFDIKRFAIHDGPGIRTTVFFKGCPLECWWCHNPEGINKDIEHFTEEVMLDGVSMEKEAVVGRWVNVKELMDELERDRIFMEESGGGISVSGGEPLEQFNALCALLELSRERNIHSTVDTSGYAPGGDLARVAGLADLILYDMKTLDDAKHIKFTGVSNTRILENLEKVLAAPAGVIIRIPLVAGFNDSVEEAASMAGYLGDLGGIEEIDILPFHPYGTHKFKRFKKENRLDGFGRPPDTRIEEIRIVYSDAGFNVRVGG